MARRLRAVLPRGWFPDAAPILWATLSGLGQAFTDVWTLLGFVQRQTRVATAQGVFLDMAAQDFLGAFPRLLNEADDAYSGRIRAEVMRDRVTRPAVEMALTDLGCSAVQSFEPTRPADTGAYGIAAGYGVAGGYGSMSLPAQFFLSCNRPHGGGIASTAGYGTGGYLAYGSASLVRGEVTDADIYAAVARTVADGVVPWVRINDPMGGVANIEDFIVGVNEVG